MKISSQVLFISIVFYLLLAIGCSTIPQVPVEYQKILKNMTYCNEIGDISGFLSIQLEGGIGLDENTPYFIVFIVRKDKQYIKEKNYSTNLEEKFITNGENWFFINLHGYREGEKIFFIFDDRIIKDKEQEEKSQTRFWESYFVVKSTKEILSQINKIYQEIDGELNILNPIWSEYSFSFYYDNNKNLQVSRMSRKDFFIQLRKNITHNAKEEYFEIVSKDVSINDIGKIVIKREKFSSAFYKKQIIIKKVLTEEREKIRIKKLPNDLIKTALLVKTYKSINIEWAYKIKYQTLSEDIAFERTEYRKWALEVYQPALKKYNDLCWEYADKFGYSAWRDLAIKNDFLDLGFPVPTLRY
ncbi:MAG TPA: hypothetical protein DCX95_07405 [Elusimicrobia bacterium]|nr:hypothetical protein [Elusimicrobiota bacterium]